MRRSRMMAVALTSTIACTLALLGFAPFSVAWATGVDELADGSYEVGVTLEGGTGRATVSSPAELMVENGRATATIVWSSPNYDYMLVDGERYLPVNSEGNSSFAIPVAALDEPLPVVGDTTAMSVPHEIDYTLTFHSEGLRQQQQLVSPLLPAMIASAAAATVAVARHRRRPRR